MRFDLHRVGLISLVGLLATPACEAFAAESAEGQADLNRDAQRILADNCFQCHGPDAAIRKAGLRLDQRDAALQPAESGAFAVVPGKPDRSELLRRIDTDDDTERMPPAVSKKHLSPQQRALLRRWIEAGAGYQQWWSFTPPTRPAIPTVSRPEWPRNAVDHFVLERLDAAGLAPSPEASRETLLRRLSFDLTGLPPTLAEIDAFLSDTSENAYERQVERLLASSHFGERMALEWLDAARFADTNGYHLDNGRDMTRWRAWVIDAFNENLPFDQFTIQQLAGDLLPNATRRQLVASGFHRNHMINFEGGAIPEEYHTAYIVDRVNTTATVWLGLTIGCAQCHDHKYDPITQRDFYGLYALFNNVPEKGLDGNQGNAVPLIPLPSEDQSRDLAALDEQIKQLGMPPDAGSAGDAAAERVQTLEALKKQRSDLEKQIPTTMVMREMTEPRETYVLVRGQYDKKGEKVGGAVPDRLSRMPAGAPNNRLGLAQWLVAPEHPLTARVAVNRYWQMLFGIGFVKTAEDFGSRGDLPSHPALLDWLAVEFQASTQPGLQGTPAGSWNVKALLKLLVLSATYRQESRVTPESHQRDPENRLLSRGPRFRLPAELIRDQALAVSGLLKHKLGGPSVSPYQPAGLWQELSSRGDSSNWTAQVFVQSKGDDLYRRSMYTFWKRTSPPPQMQTLDAPDRESCTVRRARTNTPLQALILMNDPTYVEAARKLAERILGEGGATDEQRLTFAFRTATARRPNESELAVLAALLAEQRALYRSNPEQAAQLLRVGDSPTGAPWNVEELAAWTLVAESVLNLDETVTKG